MARTNNADDRPEVTHPRKDHTAKEKAAEGRGLKASGPREKGQKEQAQKVHSEESQSAKGKTTTGRPSTGRPLSAEAFPALVYRTTVLEEVFRDAKRYFLEPLLAIEYAHTLMLAKQKIIPMESAAACLRALGQLDPEEIRRVPYTPAVEDLYFYLEQKLTELCGAEDAGRIPTARSRNDVDAAMYRMVLRSQLLKVARSLLRLRTVLIELAGIHRDAIMTAYTHQQPAQPTTLGHYLLACVEWMERDMERLEAAYRRLNRSPLGACAITTTGFPIDRYYTAELLGFEGLQVNSYGAIAAVDYLTEACSALAVSMVNLGRFMQDLLVWSTAEFSYLRLSDAFVQISSIMPQKRNPVALEHVRALASKALVQAQGILTCMHNTPFADMNDAEDDIQPAAYAAFSDARRATELAAGLLETAEFDLSRMQRQAQHNFLTVTELADVLVRSTGMSFRTAHEIVSLAVQQTNHSPSEHSDDSEKIVALVERLVPEVTGKTYALDRSLLDRALDTQNFIDVRRIPGGPAPDVLEQAIIGARERAVSDLEWLEGATSRLDQAEAKLKADTEALLSLEGPR